MNEIKTRQEPKSVFISYSSKDRQFVSRLAKDLSHLGIKVWLDDWEIDVGDNIVKKINSGLLNNQYLIIVFSPNSVTSQWVQEELSAKLYEDFTNREVSILPILIQDCEIPPLLKSRRFADFRADYYFGFRTLAKRILGQSIDSYEKRGWSRSFLGSSVNKSFGAAFFIAMLVTGFFYKLSTRLDVNVSSNAQEMVFLICKYIVYLNVIFTIAFFALWVLSFLISKKKVHRVSLHYPADSVYSSLPTKDVIPGNVKSSSFVTEHIECRETVFPDGPARNSVNIMILFSLWNRNSTRRIKIFDIRTELYATLPTIQYIDGPRAMVIIDEDVSFINQNRTIEIPPGESASFNVSYRISTNHGEFVVFGLIVYFHDDSGEKQLVRSDSIYVCSEDKVITIDESNYQDVLGKNEYARPVFEEAYTKHFSSSVA